MPGQPINRSSVELACQKARRRLRHPQADYSSFACATHSQFTCWNPGPMSAPSNCCSAIAAWRPPPDTCGSPPARCARHPVRSTCSLIPFPLSPRPPLLSTSERRAHGSSEAGSGGRVPPLRRSLSTTSMARRCPRRQRRVMTAIEVCRTAALGGHLEQCDQCGHERNCVSIAAAIDIAQNANRLARAQWIEDRQAELLEVPYFHVVFTVPEEIAAIAYQNKEVVYGILFQATAETLKTIAADPKHLGAEIGFFAVLHTWGQNLQHHPHLHCVVPGGGFSPDGQRWVSCRPRVLFARPSVVPSVPPPVSGDLAEGIRCRQIAVLRRLGDPSRTTRLLLSYLARRERFQVGGLCQAALRRPSAGPRLRGPLYPPRGDLQQPSARYRRRSSPLPVERLSDTATSQNDDLVRRRVHPAVSTPCVAGRVPAHSLLRLAGQPLPARKTGAVPPIARHAASRRSDRRRPRRLPGSLRRTHRAIRCTNVRNAAEAACWSG